MYNETAKLYSKKSGKNRLKKKKFGNMDIWFGWYAVLILDERRQNSSFKNVT